MRVAVVGGGLSGLSAALELSKHCETVLFEEKDHIGGALSSYTTFEEPVERYYHHCFVKDSELFALLDELGLSPLLKWRLARVGYLHAAHVYPMNTPVEILKFPVLSLLDIIKIGAFTLLAKRANIEKLDSVECIPYLKAHVGERAYTNFFAPLLERKFGDRACDISAAWLVERVALRSNRTLKGEYLAYLDGGFGQLITAMAERIHSLGGTIHTSSRVEDISLDEGGVELSIGDTKEQFDAVVCTSPSLLGALGVGCSVAYQASVCVLVALKRGVLDGIYWLNMDENAPFGAMIEHTNLIPAERYGRHLLYLTSYHERDDVEMQMDASELKQMYLDALCELFPLRKEDVLGVWLQRDTFTSPVYEVGYLEKVVPYSTHLKGVYAAGVFSPANYPERSMNGSVVAGKQAALALLTEREP